MDWLDYKRTQSGMLPVLTAKLARNGDRSLDIPFLVDSGAEISIVPYVRVGYLIRDLHHVPEEDSGRQDVNGNRITGRRVDFEVHVPGTSIPPVQEQIWIIGGDGWGFLGQTWFERFAVRFHNFPSSPRGRRFGIHRVSFDGETGERPAARNERRRRKGVVGGIVQPGPHARWIESHLDDLRARPDTYIVLHAERGIVFETTSEEEFAAKLETYAPDEREGLMIFNTRMYV